MGKKFWSEPLPEEEISKIEKRVKRFYKVNRTVFLEDSMTYEDLMQECYIFILELIRKYNDKPVLELTKLVHKSVGNKLVRLWRTSTRTMLRYPGQEPLIESVDKDYVDTEHIRGMIDSVENGISKLKGMERKILKLRVYQNKSFRQISNKLGIRLSGVHSTYKKSIDKLLKLI